MRRPETIEDWTDLAEFEIDAPTEALVFKLGMLAAPIPLLTAAGLGPVYIIQETQETNPTGILPIAGVEVDRLPRLLRLPVALGEWTYEMCRLAQHGIKPLPARLRFRSQGPAIQVTHVPETRTKPLQPNSQEWLTALALLNAQSALHILAVITEAGREDVCSLCGGSPSSIFRSADTAFTIESIRLCPSCYKKQSGHGATFVLLS